MSELAVVDTAELTVAERAELGRYEAVIGRNLTGFLEAARALMAIRDGKLYRATHSAFDDYCRERWDISRSYGHRMISAAEVVENLLPMGNILPTNERQVRPLVPLEPEQQVEAWKQATLAGGGKVTAAHVERTVERLRQPQPAPTPPPATVRYLVPPVPDEPEPYDEAPTPEQLAEQEAAIAEVEAEREQEEQERLAMTTRDVAAVPEAPVGGGALTGEWLMHILIDANIRTADFKAALIAATVAQLETALQRIDSKADPMRFLKVGNRRELLLTARNVADMTAPAEQPTLIDEPAPMDAASTTPTLPNDLAAQGFGLIQLNSGMWTVIFDGPGRPLGPYRSNDFYDPADAFEDARSYAAKYLKPAPRPGTLWVQMTGERIAALRLVLEALWTKPKGDLVEAEVILREMLRECE